MTDVQTQSERCHAQRRKVPRCLYVLTLVCCTQTLRDSHILGNTTKSEVMGMLRRQERQTSPPMTPKGCNPEQYKLKTVRDCTPDEDTECGCMAGHFQVKEPNSQNGENFKCEKCKDCSSLNQQTQQNCSKEKDALCVGCQPNFCWSGSSCQLCPIESPETDICGKDCKFAIGFCGFLLLLSGVFAVYCMRRRLRSPAEENSPSLPDLHKGTMELAPHLPLSEPPASLVETVRLLDRAPPCHSSLQQGRNMYAVIDTVPVRRWKEFVRGLGLRDGEIELVELEHSQFREQQYEMLKRWCQQQGPSTDAIFAVLESMQLGGCAQELMEQLHPNNWHHGP
ncbi:tumor necrosis factor receptor superfamily member 25 [Rhineura floridana]|uniref:tumor necrosis factor receptor superfamily member 25 n=1 Tax=Rhineura floridana TaxID=261503 RepID=UPI002AC7E811|nr:tumor necrosis factor receptor superfamily member 25 [Rhineura floridana]